MEPILNLTIDIQNEYDLAMDVYNIKKAAAVLRAINHALRQQIIRLIHENKSINVTELYLKLRLEQSVASQHLAILRRAGIVTVLRLGKHIYYSINNNRLHEIQLLTKNLAGQGLVEPPADTISLT